MERKRFTARKYPVAASLLNSVIMPLQLIDTHLTEDYNYSRVGNAYAGIAPLISEVDIISQNFKAALIAAYKSLTHPDCLKQIPDFRVCGSLIDGSAYYIYEAYKQDGLIYCTACWFEGAFCLGYTTFKIDLLRENITQYKSIAGLAAIDSTAFTAAYCFIVALFKKFADTESNILPQHKKQELFRCSYLNDLPGNVSLLTCNWFTELHQNNPFFVRGHWRWQPYGPGMKQYKLKWINTYKKGGYHAQAQKDKEAAA